MHKIAWKINLFFLLYTIVNNMKFIIERGNTSLSFAASTMFGFEKALFDCRKKFKFMHAYDVYKKYRIKTD